MNIEEEVIQRLQKILEPESNIEFIDERGDGRHFLLRITSKKFAEKSRLERQRMIYNELDDLLKKDHIHALRLKLSTP